MSDLPSNPSLRSWTALPRPLLIALAIFFCASTVVYALAWMLHGNGPVHVVEIGFNQYRDTYFDIKTRCIPVFNVIPESPAERAGLRAGDQIIGLNGQTLTSYRLFDRIWSRSQPGDSVDVTVRRAGEPQALTFRATFRPAGPDITGDALQASVRQVLDLYPSFFLLVGFAVLFLRVDDRRAWLLSFLFACFVAVPSFTRPEALPSILRGFTSVYRTVFLSLLPTAFYVFFAIFPEKSPLERRVPWMKWAALAVGASQIPFGLQYGDPRWPPFGPPGVGNLLSDGLRHALTYACLFLGLVSLLWNSYSAETSLEARRKSRVLVWGTLVGVLPTVVEHIFIDFSGYRPLFWIDVSLSFLVLLYPLSFAYAVVKHRVLEIPVLLRRSARFVLVQRGYFILLFFGGLLAIFLFARFFAGYFIRNSQIGMTLSAAFGVALVWVSGPFVKRGTDRIDRAFFRSSYDARVILQDLAQKTATVTNRAELACLLNRHIEQALHPKSLACYLESPQSDLIAQDDAATPRPGSLQPIPRPHFPFRFGARFILRDAAAIPATHPLLVELARGTKAWDVPPAVLSEAGGPDALAPECLVPILGRTSGLIGLLMLGPRLSEEPYSSEDKRLLEAVAGQAAIAIENMRLAEQMAERLELDRRAAHEMQIAREVQARLFPQVLPSVANLEYAGSCLQARQVGGDYYDALDLGSPQRLERGATQPLPAAAWHLAFVLADISGKGIAAALLMANLQANLRGRYALALDDLPRLLRSVNQLFYENTPDDRYATLFFGVYDDHSRELEYANCGHNPPLLFRTDGSIGRLEATSTVIGLFPKWECVTRRIALAPGDLLVIYTDGVTEATDASSNEFGESRLIDTVCRNRHLPPAQLITAIQQAVQQFAVGEQSDDLTLVIARAV